MRKFYFLLIFGLSLLFEGKTTLAQEYVWSRKSIDSLGNNWAFWWGSSCNSCNGVVTGSTNSWSWNTSNGRRNSTVDKDGNVYVIGTFSSPIKIGNFTLTNNGSSNCALCGFPTAAAPCQDFYVAKYDSSNDVIWAVSAGGPDFDVANAITVDEQGNVYIAGTMNGSNAVPVKFGTSINVYPSGQDGFVAKINPSGQWQWAHKLTGLSDECASAVKVDRYGNVYVAGSGAGFIKVSSSIAASTPAFNGGRDVFLAKIDANANPVWMKSGGGSEDDYPSDITIDNSGNIYVSLNLRANAAFGIGATAVNFTGNSIYGALLKYNNAGTPQWGIKTGTLTIAVTSDIYGNTLLTGVYKENTTFGSVTYTPFAAGKNDIFVSKINPSGNFTWTYRIGSDENSNATPPIYKCGVYNGVDYGEDWVSDIEVDAVGNIYISGILGGDSRPGTGTVCNITNVHNYPPHTAYSYRRSAFVAKINADGSCGWNVKAKGVYGCWYEGINGVGLDNYGNLYFSGNTYIWTWTGTGGQNYPLVFMLNNNSGFSGKLESTFNNFNWWSAYYGEYICRIRNDQIIYINKVDKDAYCVGDSMIVDYTKHGIYNAGNVFSLQLSDSNGEFNSPLTLGHLNTSQSGQFRVKLPTNLLMGMGYKVRVVAIAPNVVGYTNNKYLIISTYPNAAVSGIKPICKLDSVQVTGANGWYYEWTPAAATRTPGVKAPYLKPTVTTTFIMKTWNPGNCTDWDTIQIKVVARPQPTVTAPPEICDEDTVYLNAQTQNATTLQWWPPYNMLPDTGHHIYVHPRVDTTYSLVASNPYCKDSLGFRIKVNPLPIVQHMADSSICRRDSLQLFFSSNAVGTTWSPMYNITGIATGVPTMFPDTSTTYTLTASSDKGCNTKKKLRIIVLDLPPVHVISDTDICYDEVITLKASGALSYNWLSHGFIQSSDTLGNVSIRPMTTEDYTVWGSDGRCKDSAIVHLRVNPLPSVVAGPKDTAICIGDKFKMRAGGANTYVWDAHSALDNLTISDPYAQPTVTSWFKVRGTDANLCVNRDSAKVVVHTLPVITRIPDTVVCPGHVVKLFASGGVSYEWLPDQAINNRFVATPEVSPFQLTTYSVKVKDANGCSKSDSVQVSVRLKPTVTVTATKWTICRGELTTLTGSGGQTYEWSPSTGLTQPNQGQTDASPILTTPYTLRVKDVYGCEGDTAILLTVRQLPDVSSVDDKVICQRDSVLLTATSTAGTSFRWSSGESQSNIWAKPMVTTEYHVRSYDGYCLSLPEPVEVKVEEIPTSVFSYSPKEGKPPLKVRFSNHSLGKDVIGYLWDFGDTLGTSTEKVPDYIYDKPGNYAVKLKVFTANGCYDEVLDTFIRVYNLSEVYTPNSFSPNGDGLNETFIVSVEEMRWARLKIFTRWGEIIYEQYWQLGDPMPSWDGFYKGQPAQDGSYVYTIEAKGLDRQYRYLKGDITLLR